MSRYNRKPPMPPKRTKLPEPARPPKLTLDLRGLKCPLPALRTRKALAGMAKGEVLTVECTDPLAAVDIPTLLNQTGDKLEKKTRAKKVLTFRIRKA